MLVRMKRCDNCAPRGTLPKSWFSPSLNSFSAHGDCAADGDAAKATTNNAIKACFMFSLLLLEMRDGHSAKMQNAECRMQDEKSTLSSIPHTAFWRGCLFAP